MVAIAVFAGPLAIHAQQPDASWVDDYPAADSQEASAVRRARRESRLAALLAEDPFHREALDSVFYEPYLRDTIRRFDRMLELPPLRIEAVLGSLWTNITDVSLNEYRGYPDVIQATFARLHPRLVTFPPEIAARIAEHMIRIEHRLTPGDGGSNEALLTSLTRFVDDYRGTEASLSAEVALMRERDLDLPDTVTRLERFVRDHPNTSAAAEALSLLGHRIATSDTWAGPPSEAAGAKPPLVRLRRVVQLISELESGRYPRVDWAAGAAIIEQTRRLVGPAAPLASSDLTGMLDVYRTFLRAHVAGPYAWPTARLADFVIYTMGPVFDRQGDRVGGIEAALGDLETRVNDPTRLRLLRADFYARESYKTGPTPDAALAEKAARAFQLLAEEKDSASARKALATQVMAAMRARDYGAARNASEAYLAAYPESGWAWRAAINLGEALHALGDTTAAAKAYQHDSITHAEDPAVRAVASARAGNALDRIGYFDDALEAYRRAVQAATAARLAPFSYALRQEPLITRIAELERSRLVPRGDLIEEGRVALSRGPHAEARTRLDEFFATKPPASPATTEARQLLHRALLGEALAHAHPGYANVPSTTIRDDGAAMAILDRLIEAPYDFAVGAAAVARAALLLKLGRTADATTAMAAALDRMTTIERAAASEPARAEIAKDVAAIDAILARPLREIEGILPTSRIATNTRPTPAVVIRIDRRVNLASGEEMTTRVRHDYPGARWVLQLTTDEYNLLTSVINTAGRNKPLGLPMMLGNDSDPDDGPPFWERFFPPSDRPGPLMCDSCPVGGSLVEFLNDERTRAVVTAPLTDGGHTWLVLEKTDGIWRVLRESRISVIA